LAVDKPELMSGPGVLRARARPGPATATHPGPATATHRGPATAIPLRSLDHLGPDALVADPAYLRTVLAGRRGPLKALLVDQRVLAGIGNIYADEICFDARLRPDRPGGSLRARETGRLATSVRTLLEAAIVARGSTLGDQQYRDPYGQAGRFQLQHKVYGRAGLPCLSCGTPIQRLQLGAKSAYLCRKCQR
jgi:formamidopyrimidine-DNA glycosylase